MYIAKPYDKNFMKSQTFHTAQECKKFLDEYTEQKMPLDEWYLLGKIQVVNSDGTYSKIDVDEKSFL